MGFPPRDYDGGDDSDGPNDHAGDGTLRPAVVGVARWFGGGRWIATGRAAG